MNRCTEGCVLWSQHLRRWEGWWAEKEGVSGPDGSEEGKWGEVVRKQETRKPRMNRKGAKSKKFRKYERGKRKKQNRAWANKENKKTEQKEGRKWKGKEMNGEGCEKGEKEPGREHPELSEETAGEKRNLEPWGPSLVTTKASKAKYSRSAK